MHSFRLPYSISVSLLVVLLGLLTSCGAFRKGGASSGRNYVKLTETEIKSNGSNATRKLLIEANSWIGTPYRYAGNDRKGVDCSALMLNVFRDALAISLPRNSGQQAKSCTTVKRSELIAGDLVFFSSRAGGRNVGHVGMYVGDNRIIHSSQSKGVVIDALDGKWFKSHYWGAGRVDEYYAMLNDKKGRKKNKRKKTPDSPPVAPLPDMASAVEAKFKEGPSITLAEFIASRTAAPDSLSRTVSIAHREAADSVEVAFVPSETIGNVAEEPADSVMITYFE